MNKLIIGQKPIGIFDSGAGGLTIARAVKSLFPNQPIIYFGDSLHLPYGDKSENVLSKLTSDVMTFFESQNVGLVLVACNSASSVLELVQDKMSFTFPIVDVISPVISLFKQSRKTNPKVLLVGTRKTIRSNIYQKKLPNDIQLHAVEAPLLAPLVEDGLAQTDISNAIVKHYVKPHSKNMYDYCILGCTHYPLLVRDFESALGKSCEVLDIPKLVAAYLEQRLDTAQNANKEYITDRFYCTDITEFLIKQAQVFFGQEIKLELVSL